MFNWQALVKYILEGFAVAVAAFFIPQRQVELREIVLIALTAAAVFSILDQFSPLIGASARQGAGFGIGLNQVGWGGDQYTWPSTYDDQYGGQNGFNPNQVQCVCEINADALAKQVCPMHSTGAMPPAPGAPNAAAAAAATAGQSGNVVKPNAMVGSEDTGSSEDNLSASGSSVVAGDEMQSEGAIEAFSGFQRVF